MTQSFVDDDFFLRKADLFVEHGLSLEAVLFRLIHALLLGLVAAHVPLDLVACCTQFLLLAVITHLTLHGLALLVVDILLGLLWSVPGLKLTGLHRLAVAVLFLHRVRELVGELLTVLADPGLAHLLPDLSRRVVALFGRHLVTVNAALSVDRLAFATLKIDRVRASAILPM